MAEALAYVVAQTIFILDNWLAYILLLANLNISVAEPNQPEVTLPLARAISSAEQQFAALCENARYLMIDPLFDVARF